MVKLLVNLLGGKKCLTFLSQCFCLSSPWVKSEYKMEMVSFSPKSKSLSTQKLHVKFMLKEKEIVDPQKLKSWSELIKK